MSKPISLKTKLPDLYGVGSALAEKFEKLGVKTVQDLIELLPFRSEDRTQLRRINELEFSEEAVVAGTITRVSSRLSKRGVFIVQATIKDDTGSVTAIWFNQRYLLKQLREGQPIMVFGERKLVPSMGNPFFVKKIIPRLEIAPVYPATAGLGQYSIIRVLRQARPAIAEIKDVIPPRFLAPLNLPSRRLTLEEAHFNPSSEALDSARKLLAFEELLILCLKALATKQERMNDRITPLSIAGSDVGQVTRNFPWPLSKAQGSVLTEIVRDLSQPRPMNRLLYGEVGSGKTAVGLVATALVVKSGRRVLWLAPTTALAHQVARVATEFAGHLDLRVALITGAIKEDTETAEIIVGTHALLHQTAKLENIGLVVIDEQQRFGVEQRSLILDGRDDAHLLMMSATPIPRTLAHTLFGHLDISYLEGRLEHQRPVETYVFTDKQRPEIEEQIKIRLTRNQPGYVICPFINPGVSDGELFVEERKAITTEWERLKSVFPTARIGLLHGKLKPDDKEKVLEKFRDNQLDILLATSVVEVGIDNPQASWILIEEADRFGLSQLHQLRGRVGRGKTESVCFLHNAELGQHSTERLDALKKAQNGLEIAEVDLRLRGPGNIAGAEQSGLLGLRYADLNDLEQIKKAYALAEKVFKDGINKYPNLKVLSQSERNEAKARL